MTDNKVNVFKAEDFENGILDIANTSKHHAEFCNQLLSERMVKRFGNPGYFRDPFLQEPGDTHFILSTEMIRIPREPVKETLYEYLVYSPKNNCMRSAKPRWFKSDEEFRKSFDKTYQIIKTGREITVEEMP